MSLSRESFSKTLLQVVFIFLALKTTTATNDTPVNLTIYSKRSHYLPEMSAYTVPVGASLILTCHAGSPYASWAPLYWDINLGNFSVRGQTSSNLMSNNGGKFSTPSGSNGKQNPSTLEIHNMQVKENGSSIQCGVPDTMAENMYSDVSRVIYILVESLPYCPQFINITLTEADFLITITWSAYQGRLSPIYYIFITSLSSGIKLYNKSNIPSFQISKAILQMSKNDTLSVSSENFTVLIQVCTKFGCSHNCSGGLYILQGPDPTSVTAHPSQHSDFPIIPVVIGVGVLAAVLGVASVVGIVCLACIACWKWKHRQDNSNSNHVVIELCDSESEEEERYQDPQYAVVADAIPNTTHPETDSCATTSESTSTVMEGYSTIHNQSKAAHKVRIRTISASNLESKAGSSLKNVSNLVTDHQPTSPVSIHNGSGDPTHSHRSLNSSSQLEISEDNGFTSQYAMLSPVTEDEL